MEPRDAYRRPEVFAFCDARMLGAFTTTSRSAETAARECDAWRAIARRQHAAPQSREWGRPPNDGESDRRTSAGISRYSLRRRRRENFENSIISASGREDKGARVPFPVEQKNRKRKVVRAQGYPFSRSNEDERLKSSRATRW